MLVGHIALGGVLLALFTRGLGLAAPGATLSGMAYVTGAFVTARTFPSHIEVLRAMARAPLLLLAARGLALTGTPRYAAWLGAGVALSVLAGYPAVAAYSLYWQGGRWFWHEMQSASGAVLLGLAAYGIARCWDRPVVRWLALLAGGSFLLASWGMFPRTRRKL